MYVRCFSARGASAETVGPSSVSWRLVVLPPEGFRQSDQIGAARALLVDQSDDLFQGQAWLKADAHGTNRPPDVTRCWLASGCLLPLD